MVQQHHHISSAFAVESQMSSNSSKHLSGLLAVLLASTLLLCTTQPAAASRLLLQQNDTAPSNEPSPADTTATLAPSPLSQVYNEQSFASNPNFTFLPGYSVNVTGEPGTLGYTLQLVNSSTGANISAWHEIPLALEVDAAGNITLYTLVEIPTGDQAKYETTTTAPGNPIQQDTLEIKDENGNVTGEEPRYYLYGPSLGNYGGLPQTWSNSNVSDAVTGFVGDNDPMDVLDISDTRAPIGGVYRVKVLGVLGMIDANETDWKVIVINVNDPLATTYTDIGDVSQLRLDQILEFYANYKQAACFWPVAAASGNSTAPVVAPECELAAAAQPADYFHSKDTALALIQRYQTNHEWLLAGSCGSEACEDLWWPGKAADGQQQQ